MSCIVYTANLKDTVDTSLFNVQYLINNTRETSAMEYKSEHAQQSGVHSNALGWLWVTAKFSATRNIARPFRDSTTQSFVFLSLMVTYLNPAAICAGFCWQCCQRLFSKMPK